MVKVTINENVSITSFAIGIWLPGCSKLAINHINDSDATLFRDDVIVNLVDGF